MINVVSARFLARLKFALASVFFVALQVNSQAQAQTYPTQPIRIVIGYAAGGTTDILARSLAEQLSKILGQSVIVENKAGAAGNLAAAYVAQAKPDGHVLFMATLASHGINPALYKTGLGYDPVKSFEPVSMVAAIPMLLVVNPKLPIQSVPDLIAYAKKNPGQLNYASSGNGSPVHLAGAIFADAAKIDVAHIPYRGGAIANTSVMSGDTQYTFASMPAALPQVQAGKLRALAVTTKARSPQLPDIPSVEEAGSLPGYDINTWDALLAPKGTSPEVIAKLNAAVRQALQSPELAKRFEGEGAVPDTSTPQALATYIDAELLKWAAVVARTPIKVD